MSSGAEPSIRATYRLQLHEGFGFDAAREAVPYLAELGVSHLYLSPIFAARPGSTHGYDIVDHNRINPELGGESGFQALVEEVRRWEVGLILDFVPNHMGIGPENPWWADVLEWGRTSPYARYFDIDWQPLEPTLAGKVLLPVLPDHYGTVLAEGGLRLVLVREAGRFAVDHEGQSYPLSPGIYAPILREAQARAPGRAGSLAVFADRFAEAWRRRRTPEQRRAGRKRILALQDEFAELLASDGAAAKELERLCAEWSGAPGEGRGFGRLHRILERQSYRLAYWRVAAHEINYRRFFDINDLAGLRMEDPHLFEASHQLLGRLLQEDVVHGVRLDHVDGLRDPAGYFERLASLVPGRSVRVYVEKILGPEEPLRTDWAVNGTTGYEFMADVGALLTDPAGEEGVTRAYQRFTGDERSFERVAVDAKREIVEEILTSELNVLASIFNRVAKQSPETRDYTLTGLRRALSDVVAHFGVYRSYVSSPGASEVDRAEIERAVSAARRRSQRPDVSVFDFIRDVLTLDILGSGAGHRESDVLDAAFRFQQYTGPVTAKAIEDTAFYRYLRASWLNEVGGAPERFGLSPEAFHERVRRRSEAFPATLATTATHDHKRGEDVRARLAVLSEMPADWARAVRRWVKVNRRFRTALEDGDAPDRPTEYLFYQTLVGAWEVGTDPADPDAVSTFRDRLERYLLKAAREAKTRTGWTTQDEAYEAGTAEFVRRTIVPSGAFLEDAVTFAERIAPAGAVNSLAQVTLKLAGPGVPDLYQGTERWDLSLVDPDNRRPVDYALRRSSLESSEPDPDWETLLSSWRDGRIKQHLVAGLLRVRQEYPFTFETGEYRPLRVDGKHADHVVAFARILEGTTVVVVVPRLAWGRLGAGWEDGPAAARGGWGRTSVRLPPSTDTGGFVDLLTGQPVEVDAGGKLRVDAALRALPVAVIGRVA